MSVQVVGEKLARAQLEAQGKAVEPVLRGSLNSTARWARRTQYVKDLLKLFPSRSWLNQRMIIKLAGTRRLNARIIPSSSGVEVVERLNWIFSAHTQTRARIYVPELGGGRKLAAGFVNPAGQRQFPLRTRSERARNLKRPAKLNPHIRSYRYSVQTPQPALGPSVAYYFKQLTTPQRVRLINAMLQQDFERRTRKALAR